MTMAADVDAEPRHHTHTSPGNWVARMYLHKALMVSRSFAQPNEPQHSAQGVHEVAAAGGQHACPCQGGCLLQVTRL